MKHLYKLLLISFNVLTLSHSLCFGEDLPFKVGINLPLTGDVAEYGIAVRNGIELAKREDPHGFKNVQFTFDDNKYEGKTALQVFLKHRDIDKVLLSFVWGDTPSLAVAPAAESAQVPMMAVLTDPDPVRTMRYVIRFITSKYGCASKLKDYFRSNNISNIALIYAQNPYNQSHMQTLRRELGTNANLTILGDYLPDAQDFKSSILKARSGSYQILGLYLLPSQIRTFARQAKTFGLKTSLFGMDVFQSQKTINESNNFLEGAVFPTNILTDAFKKSYTDMFKDDSHLIYAANAYEFAKIIQTISESNGVQSSESVLQAIKNLPKREGALGSYEFLNNETEGQHFAFPLVLKTIKSNNVEVLNFNNRVAD